MVADSQKKEWSTLQSLPLQFSLQTLISNIVAKAFRRLSHFCSFRTGAPHLEIAFGSFGMFERRILQCQHPDRSCTAYSQTRPDHTRQGHGIEEVPRGWVEGNLSRICTSFGFQAASQLCVNFRNSEGGGEFKVEQNREPVQLTVSVMRMVARSPRAKKLTKGESGPCSRRQTNEIQTKCSTTSLGV